MDPTARLVTPATRRAVVKTGAKLAYAAPLVAASVGLTASGALAACGGTTPLPITVDGESLCCGCCQIANPLSARAQKRLQAQQLQNPAFLECRIELLDLGIVCPLIGEPGSNVQRVCIAQNRIS
jgi:hypothetical protein